jgi:hypothetical protein
MARAQRASPSPVTLIVRRHAGEEEGLGLGDHLLHRFPWLSTWLSGLLHVGRWPDSRTLLRSKRSLHWSSNVSRMSGDGAGAPRGARATIDYVSVADGLALRELERVEGGALLSLAVRFEPTLRLIDNEPLP